MKKREVVRKTLLHDRPPYVPWACGFTVEAKQKLVEHFGSSELEDALQNHILILGSEIGFFEDIGPDLVRDVLGVVWDRDIDKDIGNVLGTVLPEPNMHGYAFPDPLDQRFFEDIPDRIEIFRACLSTYRFWNCLAKNVLVEGVSFSEIP